MNQNLFDLAKERLGIDELREYMEANGTEFKNKKSAFCPFHSHNRKSTSLGIKTQNGTPFFFCFNCETGGDVVSYAQKIHKITPLEAAMRVLDFFNITYIAPNSPDISKEEREVINKEQEEHRKLFDEKRKKAQANEERLYNFMQKKAQDEAPIFAENFDQKRSDLKDIITKNFPNQSPTFEDYANTYLGYDIDHQSIAIINRDGKKVHNIKHREKFIYDKKARALTTSRMDGKWIGMPYLTGGVFPAEYFKEHTDNRVIICEGEKDALNLLSFQVNVLTLGGVTNSWEPFAHLLKNKSVYIWFDNDNAGYENALKRYYEIEKVVAEIYLVPFFSLNPALPNKYDISDFLKDNEHRIKDSKDLFHAIAYSCFKVTNDIIDEIEEYTSLDLRDYRRLDLLKDFRQIKKEFLKKDRNSEYINVFKAKGDLDDEHVDYVMNKIKVIKKTPAYDKVMEIVSQVLFDKDEKVKEASEILKLVDSAIDIKNKLLTNYRQTHIVDMMHAFLRMAKKAGYTFGEYKGLLYVWTGTHYLQLELRDMVKWIHKDWMYAARIDFKKQTVNNVEDVVKNILSKSRNLDEIKKYEKRRVINVLNGTIFISPKGKLTFVNEHRQKDAATNILAFSFNDQAKCPKWSKFLARILPSEDDRQTLMEFIGYCFLPSHDYEAFLFLYGRNGSNGKSVILDVIRSFFGEDNVSSLQLQQLYSHELDSLTGKIINIGSEIDKAGTDNGQLANLKVLVSPKDPLQINPKNRPPFQLLSKEQPKMAYAGNGKPSRGMDNAVLRRMLLLVIDVEIKDDEKIRGLSDRFGDEMAGIFNLALEGMHRLIKRGKFTRSDRMKEELEAYKDEINPLRTFIDEAIIPDKVTMVPNQYLYSLYKAYMGNTGGKALKDSNFWKSLREELSSDNIKLMNKQIRLKNPLVGLTDRARFAVGIRINTDFEINAISIGDKIIKIDDMNLDARQALPLEEVDA